MVLKVYVAMISCSQEIKKNQQRAIMILESKNIPYTVIDITDPGNEEAKDYMMSTAVPKPELKIPVTPQIFNEADYCGDYDGLDMANECDTLGEFLKLSDEEKSGIKIGITGIIPDGKAKSEQDDHSKMSNGVAASREGSMEKTEDVVEKENVPEEAVDKKSPETVPEEGATVEHKVEDATEKLKVDDATVEHKVEDATEEPKVENATEEPKVDDATAEHKVEDATEEPKEVVSEESKEA